MTGDGIAGMTSRRQFIASVGTISALAGCTGTRETGGPGSVCEAGINSESGGDVFALTPQITSYSAGQEPLVELTVPIRQATVRARNVDQFTIYSNATVLYQMPVNQNDAPVGTSGRYDAADVVEYSQSLGHVPQTGIYRIVALDTDGEQLAQIQVEFRCYRDRNEGPQ